MGVDLKMPDKNIENKNINDLNQIMLDAMPICGTSWNRQYKLLACNEGTVHMFDLPSKQYYCENFYKLSPETQPDGKPSRESAEMNIKKAFDEGFVRFEWMHQKLNGELIPCEVTLVRSLYKGEEVVSGYTRDLREEVQTKSKVREADERTQIMLDATPLCANFWDKNTNNIDCNQEAVNLFGLSSKEEYLERFFDLSPEYQPCGKLSSEMAKGLVEKAFKEGYCKFEWMHQKLNKEPIPAEITLVRVKYKDDFIVVGYTRDLRELKENMAKIREADERVQLMLDATPLCCNLWDRNFNNIECNQEAVNLFELSSKQEYLERFFELSPELQPCGRPTSEMAAENIATAFREGYCRFEWMHQKLNGEPIPSEITLVRVKYKDDYIVAGYTRDLREIKETMAKMREADERVQLMLDATPLCCNLWDRDFNNIECNQEAVNLFELSSKQEYLERFFELSPEYQPCGRLTSEMAVENIATAFRDGYCRFEWMHQKLDGEPIPSEITLVRVKHRGEYIVAGYTRDLRELKAMLLEMHKAEDDLRLARDIAEESTKAKSEFLANMSHEIRTPMNGILGLLHLVLSTELSDKQKDYLEKADKSAKTLLRIINDILDFSKIEAGKLEMETVDFSFREMFDEINNLFFPRTQEKGISFSIGMKPGLPGTVSGDPLRLKQILINLISNSVKFTKQGSIEVQIEKTVETQTGADFLFTVKDTGIGMNEKQLGELFLPFSQADTSITRMYGGTGLGLAICKNLVDMMGGKIWAESAPEIGTTFYFTVSLSLPEYDKNKISDDSLNPCLDEKSAGMQGSRILLVEDVEINQIIAHELLTMDGYEVDIAGNGKEAIEMLESQEYALILMDIQMPVMDGLTATREIRKNENYACIPIIAMSAHAMSGDRDKSIDSGMNDHITKPIDPDELSSTIKKWLK